MCIIMSTNQLLLFFLAARLEAYAHIYVNCVYACIRISCACRKSLCDINWSQLKLVFTLL